MCVAQRLVTILTAVLWLAVIPMLLPLTMITICNIVMTESKRNSDNLDSFL